LRLALRGSPSAAQGPRRAGHYPAALPRANRRARFAERARLKIALQIARNEFGRIHPRFAQFVLRDSSCELHSAAIPAEPRS
jgi:hypothetical protein